MKKNFNEILQREDYVRLTANLKERTEEIAQLIKSKMVQLDLEDETIEVEGVKIAIKGVSSNYGRYEFLAIENTGEFSSEYGEKDWWSLQDVNHTFYYAGDFTARVPGCSNKDALRFLNVAGAIISLLGKAEQEQIDEVQNVLAETEDLVD